MVIRVTMLVVSLVDLIYSAMAIFKTRAIHT